MIRFERQGKVRKLRFCRLTVHQLNRSACQADFTYTMVLDIVKIQDTSKGEKSVADDLEAVLRKIEDWHQRSIAGYRISF